ncbi:MAG: ABC transporter ATP-binding protein [Candidatus Komeilibacteria bacterium]
MAVKNSTIAKIFWQHACKYPWAVIVILLSATVAVAMDTIYPWLFKSLIDLTAQGKDYPGIIAALTSVIFLILGIQTIKLIGNRTAGFVTAFWEPKVMSALQQTSFDYLLGHSYKFFTDNFAGSLARKVSRIGRAFLVIADEIIFRFIPVTVILVGTIIGLALRFPLIAGVFAIWCAVFIFFNYLASMWKLKVDVKKAEADSQTMGYTTDALTNSTTVKIFTGNDREKNSFKAVIGKWRKLQTTSWFRGETINSVQGFLTVAIQFGLMYWGVRLWLQGIFTIGDLILVQSYLLAVFNQIWDIGRAFRNIFEALADAREMVEILELPYDVQDKLRAKKLAVSNGVIEFDNVSFYFHSTRKVLKNFNMIIQPKEKVALVGVSGAGKTTVTKLLLRFHDIHGGKILIDGINIADVTQESLRQSIALVPQDPILFHRSLMENIRYGRPGATDSEVIAASKKARCHDFIKVLPDGYDTYVGERGVKLSGGERQRVAIARAILKDAPILALDEATSSLDSESELLIQDALRKLMADKTSIVIAHRLSTIMMMDRILVMDKGEVVDSGTHQQLLKKKGIYQNLWKIQAGGFIE